MATLTPEQAVEQARAPRRRPRATPPMRPRPIADQVADAAAPPRTPRPAGPIDPFVFRLADLRAGDLRRLLRGLVGDARRCTRR